MPVKINMGVTSLRDAGPYINFKRMFGLRLHFRWLALFAEADFAMTLEPDRTLVCENNIVECLSAIEAFLGEGQPGNSVCLKNNLAVFRAALRPFKFLPSSFDRSRRQSNAKFCVK